MEDAMKIVKSLEDSYILLKTVRISWYAIQLMLLGTLGASLLENILAGKRINWAWKGFIIAGYESKQRDFQYHLIL